MLFADQVDAQPLVIPSFINGHDVVFVADELNRVYQIDVVTGAILKKVNLGRPVPQPPGCGSGANVGISPTPVIDWTTQTLFVITYVNVNPVVNPVQPTYFLHALDLVSLKDKVSPLKVVASHTQTNGAVFAFDATYEKQRAGLLFANGKVYAAFTSFCDVAAVARPIARLAFGMELERNVSHGPPGKPAQRQATRFAIHSTFSVLNLDVWRWPRE